MEETQTERMDERREGVTGREDVLTTKGKGEYDGSYKKRGGHKRWNGRSSREEEEKGT